MRSRSTYFVSTATAGRRQLFQKSEFAEFFIANLSEHHAKDRFDVHAFVVMPDHVHLLLTPGENVTIERAVTFVKGAFSYRIKKELGYLFEVWSERFHDAHPVAEHCAAVIAYIEINPVRRGLASSPSEYPFSSASRRWRMNPLPQWLKPQQKGVLISAT